MHRFFVPPDHIEGEAVRFTAAQSAQIARVLRLRPGDQVEALDNLGARYIVSPTSVLGQPAPRGERLPDHLSGRSRARA